MVLTSVIITIVNRAGSKIHIIPKKSSPTLVLLFLTGYF